MTDPFYRAEPDAAPEGARIRYSVIAGVLYLVIVAVAALSAGHKSAQVATTDTDPPVAAPSTTASGPTTAPKWPQAPTLRACEWAPSISLMDAVAAKALRAPKRCRPPVRRG